MNRSENGGITLNDITVPLNNVAYTGRYIGSVVIHTTWTGSDGNFNVDASSFVVGGGVPKRVNGTGAVISANSFTYGGATRQFIYGTARWGSGYGSLIQDSGAMLPFANGYGYRWTPWTNVLDMREFRYPFGFWPISWGRTYSTSGQWGDNSWRPGGPQLVSLMKSSNTSNIEWWMMGDSKSLTALISVLSLPKEKGGCGIDSNTPTYSFDPEQPAVLRAPTTVEVVRNGISLTAMTAVQYYRSSSFALGLLGHYDRSSEPTVAAAGDGYWSRASIDYAAVSNRTGVVIDRSGPAYESLVGEQNSFLQCLNGTIAGSIPIYDPTSNSSTPVKAGLIAGIVVAGVVGLIAIFFLCRYYRRKRRGRIQQRRIPLRQHTGGRRVVFTEQEARLMARGESTESLPVYTRRDALQTAVEAPPAYAHFHPIDSRSEI